MSITSMDLLVVFVCIILAWVVFDLVMKHRKRSPKEILSNRLTTGNSGFFLDSLREAIDLTLAGLETYDHSLDIDVEVAAFNIVADMRKSKHLNPFSSTPVKYYTVYGKYGGTEDSSIKPLFTFKASATDLLGLDIEQSMLRHLHCDAKVKQSLKPVPFVRVFKL